MCCSAIAIANTVCVATECLYHCQKCVCFDVLVPGVFVLACGCWLAVLRCELATAATVCIYCATAAAHV